MQGITTRRQGRRRGWGVLAVGVVVIAALGAGSGVIAVGVSPSGAQAQCSAPAWSPSAFYDDGEVVSHNGHEWRANQWMWPGLEPGNSGSPPWWVPWEDVGPCAPSTTTTTHPSSTTTSTPGSTTTTSTTVPPGQSVEELYAATGPWAVTTSSASVPGTPGVNLHYPEELGANGYEHPIVTWANGANGACSNFTDTLQHLASWGYVIVCPTTGQIVPEHVVAAGEWIVAQDGNASSQFHQVLDTGSVAAVGHSRGAGTSNAAAGRAPDLFTTVVPLNFTDRWTHGDSEGFDALSTFDDIPVFLAAGTSDFLVSEGEQQAFFNEVPGPVARAAVVGAGHNVIQEPDNPFQPYLTAWLKYVLEDDQFARRAFVGSPPEISADLEWDWQEQKNLP